MNRLCPNQSLVSYTKNTCFFSLWKIYLKNGGYYFRHDLRAVPRDEQKVAGRAGGHPAQEHHPQGGHFLLLVLHHLLFVLIIEMNFLLAKEIPTYFD